MGADADQANRKIGECMVADEVSWLGAKARELLDAYEQGHAESRLRTFEDVEVFWDDEVRPRLKDFHSMQPLFDDRKPPSPESRWFANWRVPDRS